MFTGRVLLQNLTTLQTLKGSVSVKSEYLFQTLLFKYEPNIKQLRSSTLNKLLKV